MKICIDSDFIIDLLRRKSNAVSFFNKYKDNGFVTTEINKFEIYLGIYLKKTIGKEDIGVANGFFDSIEVLPFDQFCGEDSAKQLALLINSGNSMGQNDIFIASIIKKNGYSNIITRNVKDFSRVEGIEVISY